VIFSNSFFVLWKEEKKCFEQSKDRLAILYNESLQKVKHFLRTPKERFLARLMTSGKKSKKCLSQSEAEVGMFGFESL
jgi:hypothetical protein